MLNSSFGFIEAVGHGLIETVCLCRHGDRFQACKPKLYQTTLVIASRFLIAIFVAEETFMATT